MAHELVRYQSKHGQEAARLLTEFWPDLSIGAEQISWMHEQNPYTDHPFIYLLFVDGKAVGMQAFYGARYEIATRSGLLPIFRRSVPVRILPAFRSVMTFRRFCLS